MTRKDDLIHRLQNEVIFLQVTKLTEEELENYRYVLRGDLGECRTL